MARRDLTGKRIIITGASSGIGRGIAEIAAARKAKLILSGRSQERLEETAAEVRKVGGEVVLHVGDITIPAERERLVALAERSFGGLDILINNAGIGATGHFQYAKEDRLRTIMEVNFFAPCELTRLAIPLLKAGNDPAIVFVNSVAGRRAIPSRSEYSASKFALMGFSEALRAELAKDDVEVHVVNPGLTESSFEKNMLENNARHSLHAQRSMSAREAGELILGAIEARRDEATFTLKAKMLIWANRFAPRFVNYKMAKFVRNLYKNQNAAGNETPAPAVEHAVKD
jgi:short-subunit dehydrogenase